jgi:hypothetical protein
MTKRLIFKVKTWPEDKPTIDQTIVIVEDSFCGEFDGCNCVHHSNVYYQHFKDGDEWISLEDFEEEEYSQPKSLMQTLVDCAEELQFEQKTIDKLKDLYNKEVEE